MNDLVTLQLSPQDALLFRSYMENKDTFDLLVKAGVFTIRNGNVTLNFDADGTLTEIKRNDLLFKKGLPIIVRAIKL